MLLILVGASILAGALSAAAIALLALDLLSASRAYVAGESRWSKARQEAVFHLDRFAESGDRPALEDSREALRIPLGDRQARMALERESPNHVAAREGFLEGANHPDDIPRMIRWFRHFGGLSRFSAAIGVWREADGLILELENLAERIERIYAAGTPDAGELPALRGELWSLNARLRSMEIEFSRLVSTGARDYSRQIAWLAVLLVALVSISLFLVFRWAITGIGWSEIKLRTTFQHAPVGMATIDPAGRFLEINDTLASILGRGGGELLRSTLTDVARVEDRERPEELIEQCIERRGRRVSGECRFAKADRSMIWARVSLAQVQAGTRSDARRFILVMEDVSESHRLAEELAYQASHDQLTGLPNRREFERHLDQVLAYSRGHGTRHALCLVDLDQFKVVNDTIGHAAGDSLLVRLAEQMQRHLRPSDILARLGGDEFGVILVDCNMEVARKVAERLRAAITNFRFYWEDRVIVVSGSIGLVELSPDSADGSRVLQTADVACYLAKEQGRNRIYVHTEEKADSARRQDEMAWVSRLNDALSSDALRFHAQMIMPLVEGHSPRCELLVRMLGHNGELYSAGQFIGAAERFNAARSLDRWVVRNALERIRRIEDNAGSDGVSAWHINLSGQSIDCDEMLPEIIDLIRSNGVSPERICFEITESAAVYSLQEAEEFFGELRKLGCQVALDDFGKGLSSFNYLKRLPVDFVKIDGSFVRELGHDELDHAMVRSIREIARIAGKQTIAECVESVETRMKLQQLEIDYAQGYAIHVPCPLEELGLSKPRPPEYPDVPERRRRNER